MRAFSSGHTWPSEAVAIVPQRRGMNPALWRGNQGSRPWLSVTAGRVHSNQSSSSLQTSLDRATYRSPSD